MIIDFYPYKAQYIKNESIVLVVELEKTPENPLTAVIEIYKLQELYEKRELTLAEKEVYVKFDGINEDFSGFGAELKLYKLDGQCYKVATAFDVVANTGSAVRYGFLSDFGSSERDSEDIKTLRKYHINMLQYYDWCYRHHSLISEKQVYKDMMGKEIDLEVVKSKIGIASKFGMKSIGYGAVYAAGKEFFEEHKEWALYHSGGKPLVFIDTFYIMNISQECPWHQHIIKEYAKAVDQVGFHGIHMDTYGFPKEAIGYNKGKKELVKLDKEYPQLIEDTKSELNGIAKENYLIFNNVGNWPVDTVAHSSQTAIYIEVWEPYESYYHIKQIIRNAQRACSAEKPVILAAYLAPFREEGGNRALSAARLLTAAIASNGAYHLLLGEENGVLTQGYYVDHSFLTEEQARVIRSYYDFLVRYMNILYDYTMEDVSFTHIGWDNTEYRCINRPWSVDGKPGTLWLNISENNHTKCINIINLCGINDSLWNKGKASPDVQTDVELMVQISSELQGVYVASPDSSCHSEELEYSLLDTDRGKTIEFTIPRVEYWTMVYLRFNEKFYVED